MSSERDWLNTKLAEVEAERNRALNRLADETQKTDKLLNLIELILEDRISILKEELEATDKHFVNEVYDIETQIGHFENVLAEAKRIAEGKTK